MAEYEAKQNFHPADESVEQTGDSPASKDALRKSAHCLPEEGEL